MKRVVVVGSGASGVHFALSVLRKGYEVLMLDVGYERPGAVEPDYGFDELKSKLSDPAGYFLGEKFEGVVYPDFKAEYYGFPPSKDYVFSEVKGVKVRANGFAPLSSFAQGGLAEAWTGGVYPFNDHELSDFPFAYKDIAPYYDEVAGRIGINGVEDDLSRFMPVQNDLLKPLDLDDHSALLLAGYRRHKDYLNRKLGCYFGRSRVATLSQDRAGRRACSYLGRCLWGCPTHAFYTPSITLDECRAFSNFRYLADQYVSHFKFDSSRSVTSIVAKSVKNNTAQEFPAERLVLAAGTLGSSRIFSESIFRGAGETVKLTGLMDNRQVLVPFVNLNMIGKAYNPRSYQYHQIALGFERDDPKEYIHGLVTTLKTGLSHPIIQNIPLDLKTSLFLFRNAHAALGLINLNFHDTRRDENYVALDAGQTASSPEYLIHYSPAISENGAIKETVKKIKRALWKLGCIVPPGMVHVRPMGASVHYAGTIPMSSGNGDYTTSEYCQSRDFSNLYVADGTSFPFLPAKNITFTLMANAVRVAECAF